MKDKLTRTGLCIGTARLRARLSSPRDPLVTVLFEIWDYDPCDGYLSKNEVMGMIKVQRASLSRARPCL